MEDKVEPEQMEKTEEKTESKSVSALDMTAIESYKYTWSNNTDAMPPVVIIIDDFGQNAGQLLDDFSALPKEIAFSIPSRFALYANSCSFSRENKSRNIDSYSNAGTWSSS